MRLNLASPGTDPAQFLVENIRAYVRESPGNRLKDIDGSPIFEEPLVGFADGDDPLFQDYKTIIADFHLTPREAFERYLVEELNITPTPAGPVSVVSFILPITRENRLSNRQKDRGPTLKWNHTRWHGEDFTWDLTRHIISLLKDRGFRAMAPDLTSFFEIFALPDGRCAMWSQRHIAYVAGLGTFGLSDCFITPKGAAVWCGSVVADLLLPPTPRTSAGHMANCPFFTDGSCGACIKRCPAGAISAQGHDRLKCREESHVTLKPWLEKPGYIGRYASCGKCQTRVPCEERIPPKALKK